MSAVQKSWTRIDIIVYILQTNMLKKMKLLCVRQTFEYQIHHSLRFSISKLNYSDKVRRTLQKLVKQRQLKEKSTPPEVLQCTFFFGRSIQMKYYHHDLGLWCFIIPKRSPVLACSQPLCQATPDRCGFASLPQALCSDRIICQHKELESLAFQRAYVTLVLFLPHTVLENSQ